MYDVDGANDTILRQKDTSTMVCFLLSHINKHNGFFCNYTKLYKIGPLGFIFNSSQRVYCFIIKIVEIYNKRSLWYIEVHTGD
jgi:hypothetical protein